MKTILISGATGFIGTHLLREIKSSYLKEYRIVLLSSKKVEGYEYILHNDYNFSENDFLNKGILEIEIIIHLGAFAPKSSSDANSIFETKSNIDSVCSLISNIPNKPKKFLFASTLDIYQPTKAIISEESPTQPIGLYGWSKLYGEKILENWAEQNSIILQVLRIGHIYGSGEESYKKIIPITIKKLLNGESPEIFSDGSEIRSYLHVSDCVKAIINATNLETYVGPVNIVSHQGNSILEIVETIKNAINPKIPILIKNQISKKDTVDFVFDAKKMTALLLQNEIPFAVGIQEEINNFIYAK